MLGLDEDDRIKLINAESNVVNVEVQANSSKEAESIVWHALYGVGGLMYSHLFTFVEYLGNKRF